MAKIVRLLDAARDAVDIPLSPAISQRGQPLTVFCAYACTSSSIETIYKTCNFHSIDMLQAYPASPSRILVRWGRDAVGSLTHAMAAKKWEKSADYHRHEQTASLTYCFPSEEVHAGRSVAVNTKLRTVQVFIYTCACSLDSMHPHGVHFSPPLP